VRLGGALLGLGAALAVSACAQNAVHQSTTFLDQYAETNPTPAHFRECHGFACRETSRISLSPGQWQQVGAVFKPRAPNARAERRQIAQAVTLVQRMAGAQSGTAVHQWTHKDMNILPNLSDPTQLDCIDEAVNTWTYMTMMEKSGFFHFHRVAQLSNAGSLHDPRNTAVLQEINGDYYAIDPALVDFGTPPPVIPLTAWLTVWPPDLSTSDSRPLLGQKEHAPAAKPRHVAER
jgi:hypothetical protein